MLYPDLLGGCEELTQRRRDSQRGKAATEQEKQTGRLKTYPIFLSSIFLSFHVLPQPLTSCQLPRSLRAFWTTAVQRLAESSFPLRSSACLCVSALRPFWLWLRLGRAQVAARCWGIRRSRCPSKACCSVATTTARRCSSNWWIQIG